MTALIAREKEITVFENILNTKTAQLIALYGRRRIGKTYLVREFFNSKKIVFFEVIGLKNGDMQQQLKIFTDSISKTFFEDTPLAAPENWQKAFELLTKQIDKISKNKKIVLFFDELPWLATKRSQLLENFDHFWNSLWSQRKNLIIVLCGSAASWMLENLINAKGGLHNRITKSILLKPFTLGQTKQYLESLGFKLSLKNILDIYMMTGGVPFYLQELKKSYSIAQNINQLCFQEDGILNKEFERLFKALFDEDETNKLLITAIAKYHKGITREKITTEIKMSSGGTLNKRLEELEAAGFIKSYVPYGYHKREKFYRVIDEYALFYLKWIESLNTRGFGASENQWQALMQTPAYHVWSGYAFESVCFKHIDQIIAGLKLKASVVGLSSWRYLPKEGSERSGAQIDLLIERNDDAFTVCEIKYSNKEFVLDKNTAKDIANKISVFEEKTKTQKQIFVALITTLGMKPSIWSEELVQQWLTLEDLFQ